MKPTRILLDIIIFYIIRSLKIAEVLWSRLYARVYTSLRVGEMSKIAFSKVTNMGTKQFLWIWKGFDFEYTQYQTFYRRGGGGGNLPPRPIFLLPFQNRTELTKVHWYSFLYMIGLKSGTITVSLLYPEIQDDGRKSNFLLRNVKQFITQIVCMIDAYILMAVPMISKFKNSSKLFSILCDASQKSKMAAHTQRMLISQFVYNAAARSTSADSTDLRQNQIRSGQQLLTFEIYIYIPMYFNFCQHPRQGGSFWPSDIFANISQMTVIFICISAKYF